MYDFIKMNKFIIEIVVSFHFSPISQICPCINNDVTRVDKAHNSELHSNFFHRLPEVLRSSGLFLVALRSSFFVVVCETLGGGKARHGYCEKKRE